MAIKNSEGQIYTEELGSILLAKSIDDRTEIKAIACETVEARAIELEYGYNLVGHQDSLASAGVQYYQLLTPSSDYQITARLTYASCIDSSASAQGAIKIALFEDATTTAAGNDTGIVISNFKRDATETAQFTFTFTPTITDNGTNIDQSLLSSYQDISPASGTSYQLLPDTKYLIQITNVGAITVDYLFKLLLFQISV